MSKFKAGKIVTTRDIYSLMSEEGEFIKFVFDSLRRHISGDWGDLTEGDKKENDFSLDKHLRLFSSYERENQKKIWIITEADRSVTTILFPSDKEKGIVHTAREWEEQEKGR